MIQVRRAKSITDGCTVREKKKYLIGFDLTFVTIVLTTHTHTQKFSLSVVARMMQCIIFQEHQGSLFFQRSKSTGAQGSVADWNLFAIAQFCHVRAESLDQKYHTMTKKSIHTPVIDVFWLTRDVVKRTACALVVPSEHKPPRARHLSPVLSFPSNHRGSRGNFGTAPSLGTPAVLAATTSHQFLDLALEALAENVVDDGVAGRGALGKHAGQQAQLRWDGAAGPHGGPQAHHAVRRPAHDEAHADHHRHLQHRTRAPSVIQA